MEDIGSHPRCADVVRIRMEVTWALGLYSNSRKDSNAPKLVTRWPKLTSQGHI